MSAPKYCLVRWISGEDKGKYSIVSSLWLKNFDYRSFDKDSTETYVVEWRDQKKPPLGGWQCFDAILLDISDNKVVLEKRIARLVTGKSPVSKQKSEEKKGVAFPELLGISDEDDSDADKTFLASPMSLKRAERDEKVTPTKPKKQRAPIKETNNSENFSRNLIRDQEEKIHYLEKENEQLKTKVLQEIPKLLTRMNNFMEQIEGTGLCPTSKAQQQQQEQPPVPQPPQIAPGKVELLPGSGVFVDLEAWLSAKGCNTPGGFVGRLLLNLFDRKTLLESNLKGGVSKLQPLAQPKKKLDEKKMGALRGAMQARYPEVKESQFGIYVNQKLTNLRSAEKKVNPEHMKTTTDAATDDIV